MIKRTPLSKFFVREYQLHKRSDRLNYVKQEERPLVFMMNSIFRNRKYAIKNIIENSKHPTKLDNIFRKVSIFPKKFPRQYQAEGKSSSTICSYEVQIIHMYILQFTVSLKFVNSQRLIRNSLD